MSGTEIVDLSIIFPMIDAQLWLQHIGRIEWGWIEWGNQVGKNLKLKKAAQKDRKSHLSRADGEKSAGANKDDNKKALTSSTIFPHYGFGKGYLNFPSQLPSSFPVVNIEYAELEHTGPLPPERRVANRKKARLDRSPSLA